MSPKKIFQIILFLFFSGVSINAQTFQDISLVYGDVSFLKDQSTINMQFVYQDIIIGKDQNEETYVLKKKEHYNSKQPGTGDNWAHWWYANRDELYEPKFLKMFFKKMAPMGVTEVGEQISSKYTLIVRTKRIKPGFNMGIMSWPAFLDAVVDIVDNSNPSVTLATIVLFDIQGRLPFDLGTSNEMRISEAYSMAGKHLAFFLTEKLLALED